MLKKKKYLCFIDRELEVGGNLIVKKYGELWSNEK